MESPGLLSMMVLFILFVNIQGPGLSTLFFPKRCPRIREQCEFRERDFCTKDKQCPTNQKCCLFNCGKKCIDLRQDICTLPKDAGPCMALFRRWWYSMRNNTCYSFVYGGCQGNNNNFQTKSNCLNACKQTMLGFLYG